MTSEMFLGIDVGTTSLKAGLFTGTGEQVESYSAPYVTQRGDNGRVEQDPDLWVSHIGRALDGFGAAHDLSGLRAIAVTSQVNTHVFVDAAGQALAPAMVWQDGRCHEQAAALDARLSEAQKMRWWGAPMPLDASHCLARMQWMADQHPDIWEKTRWVMLPKDYCLLQLTGQVISDPISNIGLVDMNLNYIPELLDLVPGAASRLPPLAGITDVAGTVRADQTAAGTPVAVCTMDAWAGMFGVGVQQPGQGLYLSGTSEVLGVISPKAEPTPGILVFPPYDDITVHAGPTQSGGASVLWFCRLFDTTPQAMARLVEPLDLSAPGPLFLPHLQGERAPLWDINSRGTLLGMDARTGPADIARAVYEGVAFSARLLADALRASSQCPLETFHCGGGGFQSDIWNQIRADVLGATLKRTAVKDPGVLGAAAMAAVAGGVHGDLQAALGELVSFDRTYQPDPARHARYGEIFQLYSDTYQATRQINQRLQEI